jgi:hypothetical protein
MTSKFVVGGLAALTAGGATVVAQANFPGRASTTSETRPSPPAGDRR